MKKVIYKYSISSKDAPTLLTAGRNKPFNIEMVKDAEILTVQNQAEINEQGIPQTVGKIWTLCNPLEKQTENRVFMIIETGVEFDKTENTKYIGTYQLYGGKIVLHLFEIFFNSVLS